MSLVTPKEISRIIKMDKLGPVGTFTGWLLMKTIRISRLNEIYDKHKDKQGVEFLDAILNEVKIKFEIPDEDLKRIPEKGAFITISNHPLGGIDGILLLKLIVEKRPDFKIIANFLLEKIEPLEPYILPVNPFETRKDIKSSVAGIKNAMQHLKEGNPLGIFPAGEVSTYKNGKLIVDKPWEPVAIKIIKKAQVPVIPIYFHARNSKLFYNLAKISDTFRSALLPSQLLSQKHRVIRVRIGKPISVKEQETFENLDDFHHYLRKKTYLLAKPYLKAKKALKKPDIKLKKAPKKIIAPVPLSKIEKEIQKLKQNNSLLFNSKNYEIYLSDSKEIKNILTEIGRLREITFRQVGEGTNKSIDLDKYDKFYKHLFLWDTEAKKIAGAYRMGFGREIYKEYGVKGFYLSELFRIEPELFPMLKRSIEMGRAFIIEEYQQKPLPLFLLWRGIIHITLRYPSHKYLMGGVSISNKFSNFSKSLMIEFMRSNYYDPYVAQFVHPKKGFKVQLKEDDKDFIFDETKADLNKFDKLIDEIEPGKLRLPVLLKKYIKQNAKLIAFNVDPKFNNAIDGLMYIKISELPEKTVKPVMEELKELEKNHSVKNGFSST